MAKRDHYYTQFEDGRFYHIYNRTVDKQPLFKNGDNYMFFLKKYDQYLSPVTDTYAYCLLGNHFHFLLRVQDLTRCRKEQKISPDKTPHDIVSHQFRKFFQSYAMAFNKQQNRVGTLFQTPFKRSFIGHESYFTQVIYYIHANPQIHKLMTDFKDWSWSSYDTILSNKPTKIKRTEVLEWFGGKGQFVHYHNDLHLQLEEKIKLEP